MHGGKSLGELHNRFIKAVSEIGLADRPLPAAVFYGVPVGIRFEIGGSGEVYLPNHQGLNPVYVEHALFRVKTLLEDCHTVWISFGLTVFRRNCTVLRCRPLCG